MKIGYNIWDTLKLFSKCTKFSFKGFFLFLKVLEELRKILRDDLGLKTTPPPLFIFYLRHNRKKKKQKFLKEIVLKCFTFDYLLVIIKKNMLFSFHCDIKLKYLKVVVLTTVE